MKIKLKKPIRQTNFVIPVEAFNDGHEYNWGRPAKEDTGFYAPGDFTKNEIKWAFVQAKSNKMDEAFMSKEELRKDGYL